MSQEELLERIKTLDTSTIERMSFEGLAMLTDRFKEPLVKEVLIRGKTNEWQRELFSAIKKGYKEWLGDGSPMYKVATNLGLATYPDFFDYIQLNLECDYILTAKGWEQEQKARLEISPVTSFVQAYESDLRNYNATANNEKTVEEKTDIKQVEELGTNEEDNNDTEEIDDENEEDEEKDAEYWKEEAERWKDELAAFKERTQNRSGINRLQSAHLGLKLAPKLGINFTDKKKLAPALSKIFGWGENSMEKRVCETLPEKEEMELANIFGQLSPDLAKHICKKWKPTPASEDEGTPASEDEAPPEE